MAKLHRVYLLDKWWVYLIADKHGNHYAGITSNIERRIEQHRSGDPNSAKRIKDKASIRLVAKLFVGHFIIASKFERYIHRIGYIGKCTLAQIAAEYTAENLRELEPKLYLNFPHTKLEARVLFLRHSSRNRARGQALAPGARRAKRT